MLGRLHCRLPSLFRPFGISQLVKETELLASFSGFHDTHRRQTTEGTHFV